MRRRAPWQRRASCTKQQQHATLVWLLRAATRGARARARSANWRVCGPPVGALAVRQPARLRSASWRVCGPPIGALAVANRRVCGPPTGAPPREGTSGSAASGGKRPL
eukprot:5503253-Pyramimonas_sp.AAC.3